MSPFATILLSSTMTLLVPYGYSSGYNGLIDTLSIKPNVYNLGGYSLNIYDLPVWLIATSLLS